MAEKRDSGAEEDQGAVEKSDRIAELEAEVEGLRARLETSRGDAEPAPSGRQAPVEGDSAAGEASGGAAPQGEVPALGLSRRRALILVGAALIVALLGFAAVFYALSRGLDSLAHKAAKTLVPGAESQPGAPKAPAAAPEKAPAGDRSGAEGSDREGQDPARGGTEERETTFQPPGL